MNDAVGSSRDGISRGPWMDTGPGSSIGRCSGSFRTPVDALVLVRAALPHRAAAGTAALLKLQAQEGAQVGEE